MVCCFSEIVGKFAQPPAPHPSQHDRPLSPSYFFPVAAFLLHFILYLFHSSVPRWKSLLLLWEPEAAEVCLVFGWPVSCVFRVDTAETMSK